MEINDKQQTAEDILAMLPKASQNKIHQLTRCGCGIATSFFHDATKTPFILVAASADDLHKLLTQMCGIEGGEINSALFSAVKVSDQ